MNIYSISIVFTFNLAHLLAARDLKMDKKNSFCVFEEFMNLRQERRQGEGQLMKDLIFHGNAFWILTRGQI